MAAGVPTVDPALVHVSDAMAASYRGTMDLGYRVEPGLHFGSKRLHDVVPGPGCPLRLDNLADPQELVDIWVMDSWVMNYDRTVYGNLLMVPTEGGRWRLVAVDHSDCFGGAGRLADGTTPYHDGFRSADSCDFLVGAIGEAGGARAVRKSIDRVRIAARKLSTVVRWVPAQWWAEAGVAPESAARHLLERAGRIEDIVKVRQWEGLNDATKGGHVLDL